MKTLIADSGSTKTDWALVEKVSGEPTLVSTCTTQGLNPLYTPADAILTALREVVAATGEPCPDAIVFYGSGCAGDRIGQVEDVLRRAFPATPSVTVAGDVLGAARALYPEVDRGGRGGIACIMGTGAIAARYTPDGLVTASSLGYILGDEGSGAWLGRRVLADYLKEQMPRQVSRLFADDFGDVTPASAIEHVYRQPFPNRYLASFAVFVGRHLDVDYCHALAFEGCEAFWRRNIARLEPAPGEPVALVGSVAFGLRSVLAQVAALHDFRLGTILKSPLPALAEGAN